MVVPGDHGDVGAMDDVGTVRAQETWPGEHGFHFLDGQGEEEGLAAMEVHLALCRAQRPEDPFGMMAGIKQLCRERAVPLMDYAQD